MNKHAQRLPPPPILDPCLPAIVWPAKQTHLGRSAEKKQNLIYSGPRAMAGLLNWESGHWEARRRLFLTADVLLLHPEDKTRHIKTLWRISKLPSVSTKIRQQKRKEAKTQSEIGDFARLCRREWNRRLNLGPLPSTLASRNIRLKSLLLPGGASAAGRPTKKAGNLNPARLWLRTTN